MGNINIEHYLASAGRACAAAPMAPAGYTTGDIKQIQELNPRDPRRLILSIRYLGADSSSLMQTCRGTYLARLLMPFLVKAACAAGLVYPVQSAGFITDLARLVIADYVQVRGVIPVDALAGLLDIPRAQAPAWRKIATGGHVICKGWEIGALEYCAPGQPDAARAEQ